MDRIAELSALIDRHVVGTGICSTAMPPLSLIRADAPSTPTPAVYEASLCLIAQGSKRVSIGEHSVVYDAAHYLLVSVELPLVGHVLDASPSDPIFVARSISMPRCWPISWQAKAAGWPVRICRCSASTQAIPT